MRGQGDFKSQKEAVWVITNLTSGGSISQIGYLMSLKVLKPLCNLLEAKDSKVVIVILDAIVNILNVSDHQTLLVSLSFVISFIFTAS